MKTGILITARLGSTRLKQKHLLQVNGSPLLSYLIGRMAREFQKEIADGSAVIVIATTTEEENRAFEALADKGVSVFYGSINNIPLRHLQAARKLGLGNIVSVDGDDVLCSARGVRLVYDALRKGAGHVKTEGLPFGMNSFGYARAFLERSLEGRANAALETGWGRIFNGAALETIDIPLAVGDDRLRFTLDYDEDFAFFKAVIEDLGERIDAAPDEEIVNGVLSKRLYEINSKVAVEYWTNFRKNVEREGGMGLNKEYQKKAHEFIPAGAHTYSRADDGYPENAPPVLERGKDAFVWDLEGNRFLDFGMALRAVTVGYDYERISNAAIAQIRNGNNLTRASKIEVEAAEALCSLIPWVEMVKFAKNGSNVTTAAVKLSRAYTGRRLVAKCGQHPFFSFDDWFIGSTVMNAGVPEEYRGLTLDFTYNSIASLEALFEAHPDDIAAVILEPATTEEPKGGFLQKIKELCVKHKTVFILDEMITGFRWHIQGAAKHYGAAPDLVTYGKGMANGFSVAALGGRREIMELGGIRHEGERVFLISTTHGAEMCGLGAFVETLKVYQELDVIGGIWRSGKRLVDGMNAIAAEMGISDYFQFVGLPCSPNFITMGKNKQVSLEFRTLFVQEMIKNGVLMPWVAVAYAHQDNEITMALEAGRKSLSVYKKALDEGVEKYLSGRAIKPVFRKRN
ncbi:MAG: glutamate-1-semialdehyde 2,1-aminomutase [Deltaproteobacteria bacterium]|nr:glutamate-1-semialdehyde 2,1-aminomutase [Deltaproteobacteria bacterium]